MDNFMEITEVSIVPIKNHKTSIAKCEITMNKSLILRGIIIRQGKNNLLVHFPSNIGFPDEKCKKDTTNRILATYIINYCAEDGNVSE